MYMDRQCTLQHYSAGVSPGILAFLKSFITGTDLKRMPGLSIASTIYRFLSHRAQFSHASALAAVSVLPAVKIQQLGRSHLSGRQADWKPTKTDASMARCCVRLGLFTLGALHCDAKLLRPAG